MDKKDNRYSYETKCKRCGSLNEWYEGTTEDHDWEHHKSYILDKSKDLELCHCKKCKKDTFQEVVSICEPK